MMNFLPLEVVCRGSHLHVGEKIKFYNLTNLLHMSFAHRPICSAIFTFSGATHVHCSCCCESDAALFNLMFVTRLAMRHETIQSIFF